MDANEVTNKLTRKEIICDGYFYDVTEFIKKHPGGSIILYYTESGEDATHAIQQFHHRSIGRVKSLMSLLKKRPVSDSETGLDAEVLKTNRALTDDFTKLYLELEKEGLFKPSYTHIILRIIESILLCALGMVLFEYQYSFLKVIGIFLYALGSARCGWIQHESGHNSLSGNPKLEKIIHGIVMGFGLGLSSMYWSRQHNRHHAMPQRLHHDIDLETMPLLAYNAKVVKNAEKGKSFMIQYQAYLFVLDTLIVIMFWMFYLHPRFIFKRKYFLQIAAVSAHWLWISYMISWYGFWACVMCHWLGSFYLLLNFTLSHTFLPVTTKSTHWVEYSFHHTANVESTAWCTWWMGYLNYQIEHHLFPTMPQFRHPLIKDRVKAFAEKHNLPYIVHSYPEALRKTFTNLSNVAKEFKHL